MIPIAAISRNLACLLGGDWMATSELGKGCTDYLTKPVDEDLLMKKPQQYLG